MKRLLSLSLFLMTAMLSFAYGFEAGGIYYTITSSITMTVKVTSGDTQYTGAVTIPSSVHYDGKTYSVTSIGGNAFYGCSGLTSVTIPNSVTTIDVDAFYGCSGLTSIEIPNSVTNIGYEAFYGCTGLTSVTIGNSVTTIGSDAFRYCSGLKKVIVPDIAAWCNIDLGDNPLSYAKHIYSDENTEITDLVIPDGVTTICYGLFSHCIGLTSVTISNSVTSIGEYAFSGCSGLTSVSIPNSVTSIGEYAFCDCSGLTSVTIPNSVTSIGGYAFEGCSGLTSVTIGNSVTTIGDYAFYGCTGLTSITIPNSVTSIGRSAFWECLGLTSVTFHCPIIGSWFGGLNIKEVVIGNEVMTIGDYAFSVCSGLTSVDIPNSVTSIGNGAFHGCSGLTSVDIPNSVTTIGNGAFHGCSGLTSVDIPNSVTSIGEGSFSFCSGLTSINIPNSVTSIGQFAFEFCTGLTSVTIPNSVTSIGWGAFGSCSGLTSVSIPNSVTSIDNYAFSGCDDLKKIISKIKEPFAIDYNCFYYPEKITLFVPAGTKEKYQSTNYWNEFTNIIEFGGEHIEPATEPKEVDMAVVPDQMDLDGMVVGDTYYVLDAENGDGADSENGCVVINTTTTDEAVDGIAGKDVSDTSVKAAFKGIIFMVPAGTGTVSINAETLGTSSLMVKIGSQPAQAFQLAERETVEIPYSVAEPTYVYIYAGTGTQAARSVGAARAAAAENSVKVYSYKWEPADPTGINSVDNSQSATGNEAGDWYTIDGRKLSGKPAQKGIYIVNGRKVAVK